MHSGLRLLANGHETDLITLGLGRRRAWSDWAYGSGVWSVPLGVSFDEGNGNRAFGTGAQRLQPPFLPVVAAVSDEMNRVTLGGGKVLNLQNPADEVLQAGDAQGPCPAQVQRDLARPLAERIAMQLGQNRLEIRDARSSR